MKSPILAILALFVGSPPAFADAWQQLLQGLAGGAGAGAGYPKYELKGLYTKDACQGAWGWDIIQQIDQHTTGYREKVGHPAAEAASRVVKACEAIKAKGVQQAGPLMDEYHAADKQFNSTIANYAAWLNRFDQLVKQADAQLGRGESKKGCISALKEAVENHKKFPPRLNDKMSEACNF
jgi:hypothetical protein